LTTAVACLEQFPFSASCCRDTWQTVCHRYEKVGRISPLGLLTCCFLDLCHFFIHWSVFRVWVYLKSFVCFCLL